MIAYFLGAILLMGIPFLIYCLWNFARELKPHRSSAALSASSNAARSQAIPISSFRTQTHLIHLREQSRSAS